MERVYSSFSSFSSLEGGCSFHPPQFTLRESSPEEPDAPLKFCGLCYLLFAFEAEYPQRIHAYKLLAENGNPESSPAFVAHLAVSMGLQPPKPGESLQKYRLARVQYSRPAPGLFPVTSALWEMMGYQPPLATPLLLRLFGLPEAQIAQAMGLSVYNIQLRLAKAVRLALRFVRHDKTIRTTYSSSSGRDDWSYPQQDASRRKGVRVAGSTTQERRTVHRAV